MLSNFAYIIFSCPTRGFSRFDYYSSLYFVGATRDGHMLRGRIYKHTYTQIEFKSTCNLGGPSHEQELCQSTFSAFHSSEHAMKVDWSFHLRVVSLTSRSVTFYIVPLRSEPSAAHVYASFSQP